MVEATIAKAVIVQDQKDGACVLLGLAVYGDERVNIRAKFDMETLDTQGFVHDLREQLAKDFDLPVYRVHIPDGLLKKMAYYDGLYKEQAAKLQGA